MTNNNVPLIPKNGMIAALSVSDFPNTTEAANQAYAQSLPLYTFEQPSNAPSG